MGYAILRCEKLKSTQSVRRSLLHSFREQETPNADPSLAGNNHHIGARSTKDALAKFSRLLPGKRRKDAVLVIEYLITGSPGAMSSKTKSEQIQYFTDALRWLKERHGDNVFYAGMHFDETTPHFYAYAVPLDPETGRLNAKRWLGGPKALSEMQTDFATRVGARHELERGILGSRAKHQTVKQFYAALSAPPVPHKCFTENDVMPRPNETPAQVAARLTKRMQFHYDPATLEAAEARFQRRNAAEKARLAAETIRQAQEAQAQLIEMQRLFEGFDMEQVAEIMDEARANLLEQNQERPRGG